MMTLKHNTKENFEYSSITHNLIEAYVTPEEEGLKSSEEWESCPRCLLKPKVWIFDNGREAGCGCHNDMYDHFRVGAECVASVVNRTGGFVGYDSDDLRKNWNHYCRTGEFLFSKDYPKVW